MDVDDTVRAGDATLWLHANGNVGIGQSNPTAKLTVEGTVQSNSGGFKFPDGSVQTTAAANTTYTTLRDFHSIVQLPNDKSFLSILHLDLPVGTYVLTASMAFFNHNGDYRIVECHFSGEQNNYHDSTIFQADTITIHTVANISSGGVDVQCQVDFTNNSGFSNLTARNPAPHRRKARG